MSNIPINPPDFSDAFDFLKEYIFAYLNCVSIGTIESVNKNEQTVEVSLVFKRRIKNNEIIDYPLLVDVPFFVLQGGGAFLDLPIKKGDFALVLFCDRNIDDWWTYGSKKEPKTLRKHHISDGIALIGINPKPSVLSIDNTKAIFNFLNYETELKATKFNMLGATEVFIKGTTLCNAFTALCATIATATSGTTAQNAAGIETIKTAFATFNGQINNFKSSTIKGE